MIYFFFLFHILYDESFLRVKQEMNKEKKKNIVFLYFFFLFFVT